MKKELTKGLLERLANAPSIVAKQMLDELKGEDKSDFLRLLNALKIDIQTPHTMTIKIQSKKMVEIPIKQGELEQ